MTTYEIDAEVPGGFADDMDYDPRRNPVLRGPLCLEFSGWLGAHIVASSPYHAITRQLAGALRSAGVTGYRTEPMRVTTDLEYEELFAGQELPAFVRLIVTGADSGSDLWTDKSAVMCSDRAATVIRRFPLGHGGLISDSPEDPAFQRYREPRRGEPDYLVDAEVARGPERRFEDWAGGHGVRTGRFFAVTTEVAQALWTSRVSGFRLEPLPDPGGDDPIVDADPPHPQFLRLVVTGARETNDLWMVGPDLHCTASVATVFWRHPLGSGAVIQVG